MDLKQKAANAWEAREAREYAIEAGRQGNVGIAVSGKKEYLTVRLINSF